MAELTDRSGRRRLLAELIAISGIPDVLSAGATSLEQSDYVEPFVVERVD